MHRFKLALLTAAFILPCLSHADEFSDVKVKILAKYPNNQNVVVSHSQFPGIYEVDVNKNVAYTDKDVKYMIFGHVFDLATQTDLTQKKIDDLSKVDFSKLPLKDAIKIVKGNGSHKFAVFSDPECPYCKQLETSLQSRTDYTEYVFLFPLDNLHPGSSSKSQSVWCSKNKVKSWTDAVLEGVAPETKSCPNPIETNAALGKSMGIQGTPTLINQLGHLAPGALSGPMLDNFLQGK